MSSVIGIDFDGTCVTHMFPDTGKDIGAQRVIKKLVARGHKIIIFTMRSGSTLQQAELWFAYNEIPVYGVNINPTQKEWTNSPKAYCHLYIDDAALGIPLVHGKDARPYVDWDKVETLLIERSLLG